MIHQMVKGSRWRLTKTLQIRQLSIPSGTEFEVVYPRRREVDTVAIKFLGDVELRKERKKRRFQKADAIVAYSLIAHSELVSKPAFTREFFIQEIDTGHFYVSQRRHIAGFYKIPTTEASFFVSYQNAAISVVGLCFKYRDRLALKAGPCPYQIISVNPFTGEQETRETLSEAWFSLTLALAEVHDKRVEKEARPKLKRIANHLGVLQSGSWEGLAIFHNKTEIANAAWLRELTDPYMVVDANCLLLSDHDRVMVKIAHAGEASTYVLESIADAIS